MEPLPSDKLANDPISKIEGGVIKAGKENMVSTDGIKSEFLDSPIGWHPYNVGSGTIGKVEKSLLLNLLINREGPMTIGSGGVELIVDGSDSIKVFLSPHVKKQRATSREMLTDQEKLIKPKKSLSKN